MCSKDKDKRENAAINKTKAHYSHLIVENVKLGTMTNLNSLLKRSYCGACRLIRTNDY